jgi:hypothetical protein
MVMKILCPTSFIPEKDWIIDVLFRDFLGIMIQKEYLEGYNDYVIVLNNNSKLIICDGFFRYFNEIEGYIESRNIPNSMSYFDSVFLPEKNFPVFFGLADIITGKNIINCKIDLFAMSFFFLSRWEEIAVQVRDVHNRFPIEASLAYKYGFSNRPIVNEIVEALWNMLFFLDSSLERKERQYEFVPTHDVDKIHTTSKFDMLKKILKGEISLLKKILKRDPLNTFKWLMKCSKKSGWVSQFYFMGCGYKKEKYDRRYDPSNPFIIKVIKNILRSNHICGFHPGYYTYNDEDEWLKEKKRLEKNISYLLVKGRQHYLRFSVPETWRIWEKYNMLTDSSLGFASSDGFRAGTGDAYRVFDVLNRQELRLQESPLIIMDGSLSGKSNRNLNSEESEIIIKEYIDLAKKYKMRLTVLFHSNFFVKNVKWRQMYENILVYSQSESVFNK